MNYIYVHHHNNKITLMNANCQKAVLVAHIQYTLKLTPTTIIDLLPYPSEAKPTAPVGVPDKADDVYADTFLTPKGNYILLQVRDAGESEDMLGTPSSPLAAVASGSATTMGAHQRDLVLVWESPKPEFTEKVAAMLSLRAGADTAKKGAARKAGKK